MLDLRYLRNHLKEAQAQLEQRGFSLDEKSFSHLLRSENEGRTELEALRTERNQGAKTIGQKKAKGEDTTELMSQMGALSDRLELREAAYTALLAELNQVLMELPNIPDPSTPSGKSEDENVEVKKVGTPSVFDFEPKDHVDLAAGLGGFNPEAAQNISGARFTILSGDLARLHRALAQFMLDKHTNKGFVEHNVPVLVHERALLGTGQLPKFGDDLYQADEMLYLAPTSEVMLTNIVRESMLDVDDLPMKLTAHTPCFRKEAGSYGRDVRGMIRQHQFEKVEMVMIAAKEQSHQALEMMTTQAESILEALNLPYRRMLLCAGDIGFSAQKTYDLEVYLPAPDTYREISSCSNCGDFQARRMGTRYKDAQGKKHWAHTLNGSGLAIGRTLVAILENYQNFDGSVDVPEALHPYMNGITKLTPVS